jgi:hypothetical protein
MNVSGKAAWVLGVADEASVHTQRGCRGSE